MRSEEKDHNLDTCRDDLGGHFYHPMQVTMEVLHARIKIVVNYQMIRHNKANPAAILKQIHVGAKQSHLISHMCGHWTLETKFDQNQARLVSNKLRQTNRIKEQSLRVGTCTHN